MSIGATETRAARRAASASPSGAGSAAAIRVLLAAPRQRQAIHDALAEHAEIVVAGEADTAAFVVHAAVTRGIDVVMLDAGLHGGALSAAWEIHARLPHVKTILLTTRPDDDELVEAIRAGVAGYLPTSVDAGRLPSVILDVYNGGTALPRSMTSRIVDEVRRPAPTWRSVLGNGAKTRLTSREWQVLELLERELSTLEIAERLFLTPSAVRCHISAAMKKLGARSRSDAVRALRSTGT